MENSNAVTGKHTGAVRAAAIALAILTVTLAWLYPGFEAPASAQPAGAGVSVVGGHTTTVQEWPWQVALTMAQKTQPGRKPAKRQFCGGSLIAPTVIVTAAHCVLSFGGDSISPYGDPASYTVIAGRTRLNQVQTGKEIAMKDVFVPLTRDGVPRLLVQANWDVAVVELAEPAPAPAAPIKILGPTETDLLKPGTPTFHTGWGIDGRDRSPVKMKVGRLNLQPKNLCHRLSLYIGDVLFDGVTDLCVGSARGGAMSCSGDSGGPVAVRSTTERRLIGATSRGLGCSTREPGIDTSVASGPVRDWIVDATVNEIGADDPTGSGAVAPPLPALCKVPKVRGLPPGKARQRLKQAGCPRVKLKTRVTYRRGKAKLPPARVTGNPVMPGWLWDRTKPLPLSVKVVKRKPNRS